MWRALGIAFVATGFVGAFVPGLPTTPFLILAAACYTRGDPAARARLVAHPRFGPALRAWFDHGVVSRRAKMLAIGMMGASASFGIWIGRLGAVEASVVIGVVACVATWLALRPERTPDA
ncbi:MAG: YbaN family protein [Planctomycetota bacterium]|nr:YbaN family protein [Planctomycetota bacterium]